MSERQKSCLIYIGEFKAGRLQMIVVAKKLSVLPGNEVLSRLKWNTLKIMYQKRLLILAHQAYYHLLPCPMNCLFEKYISSSDLRRKMTFKLLRPNTDMVRKSCSYKSIILWKALKNEMRSIHDTLKSHPSAFLRDIHYKVL